MGWPLCCQQAASLAVASHRALRASQRPYADLHVVVHRTDSFEGQTDIAELFARHAGLAIHNASARDNLAQAVVARHRAGVAHGILMSRLGCSQDQAIAILKHRSQRTNRKLRIIADEVIRIGDLKRAPTDKERDRLGDAEDPSTTSPICSTSS
jgi:ANTAR domain